MMNKIGESVSSFQNASIICEYQDVFLDKLPRLAHLILIEDNINTNHMGLVYVREIVRLHSVPKTIILGKDIRFILIFWQSLWRSIGIRWQLTPSIILRLMNKLNRWTK